MLLNFVMKDNVVYRSAIFFGGEIFGYKKKLENILN